jgi:hypothetical protein
VGQTLFVSKGGVIEGKGKLIAGNRVLNGGSIGPGLSPGTIEIDGNYEQTADGVLDMEAAGLAPGEFDVLHVTGHATLDGKLQLRFLNGYLPKTGDVLPLLQIDAGAIGDFSEIRFPQLAPGFETNVAVVNGKYQLTALTDAVLQSKVVKLSSHGDIKGTKTVLNTRFTISGTDPTPVLIRGLGPSAGGLSDPVLQLTSSTGTTIATNDNWKSFEWQDEKEQRRRGGGDFRSGPRGGFSNRDSQRPQYCRQTQRLGRGFHRRLEQR